MGMTIDEYIKRMGDIRSNYDRWSGLGLTPNETKVFDISIETMRKYEKIEQIVSDFKEYQKGISCGFGGEVYMQMVSEVIEDGKIDCN